MRRRAAVTPLSLLFGAAIATAATGCANTETLDSGWNVGDTGRRDATAEVVTMDVPRDTPRDTPAAMDTTDVPRDVPRDVAPDRTDTGTMVTDTGGGRCPSSCVNDIDCMAMCPAAGVGYLNCCLAGSGGGTCYQYMGSVCPGGSTTDSGTGGSDASVFDTCRVDSDCTGSTNCCAAIDFGGTVIRQCGCASPFGCTAFCP